MNIFKKIGSFFTRFGKLIWSALEQAGIRGLSDELLKITLAWVRVAAEQQLNNEQKRAFVIGILKEKFPHIPESIIRLAIELAVQVLKEEVEKI